MSYRYFSLSELSYWNKGTFFTVDAECVALMVVLLASRMFARVPGCLFKYSGFETAHSAVSKPITLCLSVIGLHKRGHAGFCLF